MKNINPRHFQKAKKWCDYFFILLGVAGLFVFIVCDTTGSSNNGFPDLGHDDSGEPDSSTEDGQSEGADSPTEDGQVEPLDSGASDSSSEDVDPLDSGGPDVEADSSALDRHYFGYFPSWSENYFDDRDWQGIPYPDSQIKEISKMAGLNGGFTHVAVAFVQPDLSFDPSTLPPDGGCNATGMQFSGPCRGIKAAIRIMHNEGHKVILAVGGATYNNWQGLVSEVGRPIEGTVYKKALRDLIDYLEADGLDVDYEIGAEPGSAAAANYAKAIIAMREAVEAATNGSKWLTLAGWSTGADCTADQFSDASINGGCSAISYWGGSAGRERDVLQRSISSLGNGAFFPGKEKIRDLLDEVSVMSYDARFEHFDASKAFSLYRAIFPGKNLNLGLEIAPESWEGGILVCNNSEASWDWAGTMILQDQEGVEINQPYSVERLITYVKDSDANGGAMLWHVLKNTAPTGACNPEGVSKKVMEILKL